MKTSYLLYEVIDKKKFKVLLVGEYPGKSYAKNKILRYVGQGKTFIIKRAIES